MELAQMMINAQLIWYVNLEQILVKGLMLCQMDNLLAIQGDVCQDQNEMQKELQEFVRPSQQYSKRHLSLLLSTL